MTQQQSLDAAMTLFNQAQIQISQAMSIISEAEVDSSDRSRMTFSAPTTEKQVAGESVSTRNEAAYQRLLPKLKELAQHIDALNDDEFGDWVNQLPHDEFLEFITLKLDEETRETVMSSHRLPSKSTDDEK